VTKLSAHLSSGVQLFSTHFVEEARDEADVGVATNNEGGVLVCLQAIESIVPHSGKPVLVRKSELLQGVGWQAFLVRIAHYSVDELAQPCTASLGHRAQHEALDPISLDN
jgi:hypothetical protein